MAKHEKGIILGIIIEFTASSRTLNGTAELQDKRSALVASFLESSAMAWYPRQLIIRLWRRGASRPLLNVTPVAPEAAVTLSEGSWGFGLPDSLRSGSLAGPAAALTGG